MSMNTFQGRVLAGLLALSAAAGLAQAQPKTDEPALKGPEVKDNSLPGQKRSFGEGNKDKKAADRPIPFPVVVKALDALRGEQAGDNRLTDDQNTRLKGVQEEFQKATREHLEKNRDEIASLRAKLTAEDRSRFDQAFGGEGRALRASKNGFKGKAPKDAAKPDAQKAPAGDEMMNPAEAPKADPAESAKARARLMEILAARPKPEDAQAKAWSILTEPQRKVVQDEVVKLQKEGPKKAAKPAADFKNKTADEIMNDPRLPERLRERLKNMSPEDREAALKRLRERGLEAARQGRGNGGTDKPAPSPADVNVPSQPK